MSVVSNIVLKNKWGKKSEKKMKSETSAKKQETGQDNFCCTVFDLKTVTGTWQIGGQGTGQN
jgi:hypothetical protein